MASANEKTLDRLAADVAAKRVHVPITATFTLDQVPGANAGFPAGTMGKQSITV